MRTNMFDKSRVCGQRAAWMFVLSWRKNAHGFAQIANDHLNWTQQIRVVGNHYGALIIISETIHEHLRRQVYVRAFLLSLDDIHISFAVGHRHIGHMRQKTSQNNIHIWQGFQSPQVGLLAVLLVWVVLARVHQRGEVIDSFDLMAGEQDFAQRGKVQPFIKRAFDCAIIEIEPVYV